jgi:hypothetical protein
MDRGSVKAADTGFDHVAVKRPYERFGPIA